MTPCVIGVPQPTVSHRNPKAADSRQPANEPMPLRQALALPTDRFPHIHLVQDYAVLRRIGELRHRTYVETQGKGYVSAVFDRGCLIEPSDFSAVNIYARDAAGITCAMRVGEIVSAQNPQRRLLEDAARQFDVAIDAALTCTRLVRAQRHNGRHVVDLIQFVRWQAVRAGWRYCLMQTAERLVPFFRKFEFYETGVWSQDGAAGRLQVMIVDTKSRPVQEGEG
jgi:hypothetical protein